MKFAIAALLGLVSTTNGELVQCPYGHYHHHDEKFGQKQFGIPTNETQETQVYDDKSEHHGCPFKNAIFKLKSEVKDSFSRNTEHHDSPFYDPSEIKET